MAQPDLGDAARQEPPPARREPAAGVADIQEAPEKPEADEPPAAEEQPAAEHEAIRRPRASHSTEERHAIADQPTEMYDVEDEFAATEAPAPPDEDIVAEEMTEARLGPAEPLPTPEPSVDDGRGRRLLRRAAPLRRARPGARGAGRARARAGLRRARGRRARRPTSTRPPASREGRDSDEDVLEETPDFLEETPEDDELWFEQKPPKDFDFDD